MKNMLNPQKQNIWVNLALSFSVIILILGLLEITARIIISHRYGDADYGAHWKFTYEPYIITKVTDTFKQEFHPSTGKPRLLILGASSAESLLSETVEKTLKERLNIDSEVVNLAQGGHIANQELVIQSLFALKHKPDIIITMDGANDILSVMKSHTPGIPYTNVYVDLAMNKPFVNLFYSIIRNSQFFNSINKFRQRSVEINSMKDSSLWESTLEKYLSTQKSMAFVSQGINAKHLLILQPYLENKNPLTEKEVKLPNRKAHFYRLTFMLNMFSRLDDSIKNTSFPGQFSYFNGSDVFRNCTQDCFSDEVHFTDKGREILIEYIGRKLLELGWLSVSSQSCSATATPR